MSFRLRTTVTDGLRLTFSRNGAVFVGCNAAAQLVTLMLLAVAASQQLPVSSGISAPLADVPASQSLPTAATGLSVGLTTVFSAIVTTPITIITIRTFVDGATDHIPESHLYGRLGRATARGLVASLVFGVVIFVGFLCAFLLPTVLGIGVLFGVGQIGFLPEWIGIAGMVLIGAIGFVGVAAVTLLVYIHLLFSLHEVSVRNRSVIASLRGSWGLVRGHRLRLGVLSVGVIAVQSAINSVGTPNQLFEPTTAEVVRPSVSQLFFLPIGVILTAFVTTLSAAIIARAYAELTTVDAVGGQRRDIDDSGDQRDQQADVDTNRPLNVDTEPTS